MEIREAKLEESKQFSKLYGDILWESFDYRDDDWKDKAIKNWNKEKVEKRIKRDDYLMLVAEDSGEFCGYLASLIKGDLSFVRWMGVKKDYQGKGIGTKLIKYWEKWAVQKGVKKLRLSTYLEENKGLYEKLGFKLSETQEKSVGIKYRLAKEL